MLTSHLSTNCERVKCLFYLKDNDESQTVQPGEKMDEEERAKEDEVVIEDDFSLWCLKMSVFFKKKFFPAAEKYELLNKIAHDNA